MQQIFLFLTLPVSFQMVQCARSDSTAHNNLRVFAGSACQCHIWVNRAFRAKRRGKRRGKRRLGGPAWQAGFCLPSQHCQSEPCGQLQPREHAESHWKRCLEAVLWLAVVAAFLLGRYSTGCDAGPPRKATVRLHYEWGKAHLGSGAGSEKFPTERSSELSQAAPGLPRRLANNIMGHVWSVGSCAFGDSAVSWLMLSRWTRRLV